MVPAFRPHIYTLSFASDGTGDTKNMLEQQDEQSKKLKAYSEVSGIYRYNFSWLHATPFYRAHKAFLDLKRGAGYWLWKPYLILQTMTTCPDNSFVVYLDCDLDIRFSPAEFTGQADRKGGIAVIESPFLNRTYTKRDTFIAMGSDADSDHECTQAWAAAIALKNIPEVRLFVLDYLSWCLSYNYHLIDDTPSYMAPELAGFADHRHDQSILTLMLRQIGLDPLPNRGWAEYFGHPSG